MKKILTVEIFTHDEIVSSKIGKDKRMMKLSSYHNMITS